jgi:hypothetical protein
MHKYVNSHESVVNIDFVVMTEFWKVGEFVITESVTTKNLLEKP